MGYGARAVRTPARGGGGLSDVDIFKIGIIGRPERGFENTIQDQIYSFDEYSIKCGRFGDGTDYIGYVVKSFFDELNLDNPVEVKVLGYVASDAAQATLVLLDQHAVTPASLYVVNAGRLNVADKSAFGNKIAVKITSSEDATFVTTAGAGATPTTAVLDDVTNLEVGNYIHFLEGINDDTRVITAIDTAAKSITFAAMAGTYTTAVAVTRVDIDLRVAVEDDKGNYVEKERWIGPSALSATVGINAMVNDTTTGSNYIILAPTSANATDPELQIPADITAWTPLASGSDGAVSDSDSLRNTLLNTYFTDTDITFLLSPESATDDNHTNMAAWCTDGYKCMYYAQAASGSVEAGLRAFGGLHRKGITFSMLPSDKWIYVQDPRTDGKKLIPKVGIDAAYWFNTYAKFGESKVAAGNKPEMVLATSGTLDNTNGLVHDDALGVGSRLIRDYSVNICKFTRGVGVTNNSARTLSTDDGYKYQNQIMQWLLYKKSILAYLQSIEQDRAGVNAQGAHYRAVWNYMNKKYKAGHFYQGQKEDGTLTNFNDVVTIVNDFSINTLADIANGIEQIFLQFIAPPPIEEPILRLASASVTAVRG